MKPTLIEAREIETIILHFFLCNSDLNPEISCNLFSYHVIPHQKVLNLVSHALIYLCFKSAKCSK